MSGENNRKCNENVSSFNRDAMSGLMIYQWKGNVRELENVVSRAVILSRGKMKTWFHCHESTQNELF